MRKRSYAKANTRMAVDSSKRQKRMYRPKVSLPKRLGSLNTTSTLARGQYVKAYLKYTETFSLNPGVGGANATYVLAANGLYDPNITGAGHQPAGFDQYMALYELYTVTAAYIKAEFYSLDGGNTQLVAVANRDIATTNPDLKVYIENGGCKWTTLGRQGAGNDVKTVTNYMNMNRFGSYKDLIDGDDNAGTDSSNPAETQYFHVIMAAADGATDTLGGVANVEITYEVYFRQPKQVALS